MNASFRLATFRADVTPPLGSPLCGGLIQPVIGVSDPLYALGVVILPEDEAPIVLCAIDWCEICNEDHAIWRQRLAEAAGTTPERVAVQCVHQHDAPLTDLVGQRLLREYGVTPDLMNEPSFHAAIAATATAIRGALPTAEPVTAVRVGQAKVEQVASNRRVPNPDGTLSIRWSRCTDPKLRAAPEGLIDPWLKAISCWSGDRKLAVLHYYAVHPMSYYGDGWVTADFAGLARERRTAEDGGALHVYFTGGAGNLTAGKYNDGAPENRPVLAERIHRAMVEAEVRADRTDSTDPSGAGAVAWSVREVLLPPRTSRSEADLRATLADPARPVQHRKIAALWLSFLERTAAGLTIPITALHLGDALSILHLPGEAFIEYQLYAQSRRPDAFVAVASYGDIGMSYIPMERSYSEVGGYEESWAFAAPESEWVLKEAIDAVLAR